MSGTNVNPSLAPTINVGATTAPNSTSNVGNQSTSTSTTNNNTSGSTGSGGTTSTGSGGTSSGGTTSVVAAVETDHTFIGRILAATKIRGT